MSCKSIAYKGYPNEKKENKYAKDNPPDIDMIKAEIKKLIDNLKVKTA
jgi:hypothetical protein